MSAHPCIGCTHLADRYGQPWCAMKAKAAVRRCPRHTGDVVAKATADAAQVERVRAILQRQAPDLLAFADMARKTFGEGVAMRNVRVNGQPIAKLLAECHENGDGV